MLFCPSHTMRAFLDLLVTSACFTIYMRLVMVSASCDQKVDKRGVFCDGPQVSVSLSCPAEYVVVLRETSLLQGDGPCPSASENLQNTTCVIVDSLQSIWDGCNWKNDCNLVVDISSYSGDKCSRMGQKFIYVVYQCDPEFYVNDRAKSTVISSLSEDLANLLYIYSHPSVAEVPKGCIIRVSAGTNVAIEVTMFSKYARDCSERVIALLIHENYDICNEYERHMFDCNDNNLGIFIYYEAKNTDVRSEFVIKVSTPPQTDGFRFQCGVNKTTYLQEYATSTLSSTKGPSTTGTSTRGTSTRGTSTRGTSTRGTSTRGTSTRGTSTRGISSLSTSGPLTTASPGVVSEGPTTQGVRMYPRTSNYDLLIGAVCSAAILLVLIVIATLAVGCRRENNKLRQLENEADSRFRTIRRNIYLDGQSNSRLVLTKSEQI